MSRSRPHARTPKGATAKDAEELLKSLLVLSRTTEVVLENRPLQVAAEPLSKPKLQILRLLAYRGGQALSTIAAHLGVTRAAVTQMVNALETLGLVSRRRSEVDRRGIDLVLTEKGEGALEKVLEEQHRLVRSAIRDADPKVVARWVDEMKGFAHLLAQANRDFEEHCLQCRAHADGSCVLAGENRDCPVLGSSRRGRRRSSKVKARGRTPR